MKTRRYTQPFLILLLLALLAACGILPGPPTSPLPTPAPQANPEEEYYRGVFDACGAIMVGVLKLPRDRAAVSCYQFTLSAYRVGAYDEPTGGWRWPLAEPTPEKEARGEP